ncbi:MAG: hypothetical protein ACRDNZ_08350, partial [Streptosporangiaceae bacterium]
MVIPADLGAELAGAIRHLVAAGKLPASATGLRVTGTWRPGLPGAALYATSLPFELARLTGGEPGVVAARLGAAMESAEWITSAESTGGGYLTIGVTSAALSSLAARISRAGPACLSSDALRGTSVPAPPLPDLAAAPGWRQAWREQRAALAGRLALAAGATVSPFDGAVAGRQPGGPSA